MANNIFGATDGEPGGHNEYKSAKEALRDSNIIVRAKDKDKLALFSRAYHGSPHDHDKDISITAKFSRAPKYVNIKLIDIDGDEVVWDGDPDKHPGRMLADDAIREVDDRIANLKRLIECLK